MLKQLHQDIKLQHLSAVHKSFDRKKGFISAKKNHIFMSLQFSLNEKKKLISRRWPDVYIFGLTTEKKNSRNENVDSHLFAFGRPSANIKTILKIIASLRTK